MTATPRHSWQCQNVIPDKCHAVCWIHWWYVRSRKSSYRMRRGVNSALCLPSHDGVKPLFEFVYFHLFSPHLLRLLFLQMPPQYGQQGVSGYCQQGQQPYYNQQPQPPHLPPQAQYLQPQSQQRYQPQQVSVTAAPRSCFLLQVCVQRLTVPRKSSCPLGVIGGGCFVCVWQGFCA